jgi:hypothetical protein
MYRVAANTNDPKKWIALAVQDGWTTRRLIDEVKNAEAEQKSEEGVLCHCGCEAALPKQPIYVGGHERTRRFFATIECMLAHYAKELQLGLVPKLVADAIAEQSVSIDPAEVAAAAPAYAEFAPAMFQALGRGAMAPGTLDPEDPDQPETIEPVGAQPAIGG